MAAVRKQMFENSLQMRKRIDEVLTPEQRQKLGR
jgi:Spy/CpxP family protein refolding chaperone